MQGRLFVSVTLPHRVCHKDSLILIDRSWTGIHYTASIHLNPLYNLKLTQKLFLWSTAITHQLISTRRDLRSDLRWESLMFVRRTLFGFHFLTRAVTLSRCLCYSDWSLLVTNEMNITSSRMSPVGTTWIRVITIAFLSSWDLLVCRRGFKVKPQTIPQSAELLLWRTLGSDDVQTQ